MTVEIQETETGETESAVEIVEVAVMAVRMKATIGVENGNSNGDGEAKMK
jgi:hypothetical protein